MTSSRDSLRTHSNPSCSPRRRQFLSGSPVIAVHVPLHRVDRSVAHRASQAPIRPVLKPRRHIWSWDEERPPDAPGGEAMSQPSAMRPCPEELRQAADSWALRSRSRLWSVLVRETSNGARCEHLKYSCIASRCLGRISNCNGSAPFSPGFKLGPVSGDSIRCSITPCRTTAPVLRSGAQSAGSPLRAGRPQAEARVRRPRRAGPRGAACGCGYRGRSAPPAHGMAANRDPVDRTCHGRPGRLRVVSASPSGRERSCGSRCPGTVPRSSCDDARNFAPGRVRPRQRRRVLVAHA